MLRDKPLELGHQLAVVAQGEIGVDPVLDRRKPKIFESPRLESDERLVGEIRQRRTSSQRQRTPQAICRRGRIATLKRFARLASEPLEAMQIYLIRFRLDRVAAGMSNDRVAVAVAVTQRSAELRDVDVSRVDGRLGRIDPQSLDQRVARDRPVRVQKEICEECTRFARLDCDLAITRDDLQGTEDSELQLRPHDAKAIALFGAG